MGIAKSKVPINAPSFVPAAAGVALAEVHSVSVTITNAQLKALRATPITIIPAPGAGKINMLVAGSMVLKAGTNAVTENVDNLALKYNNGSGVQVSGDIECTGFIDQTADTATSIVLKQDAIVAVANAANKAIVLHNIGSHEFAGNAAADATLIVNCTYRIRTTS